MNTTPSFVTEIPLRVNSKQARVLRSRFEAGRQIYNACLGETLKRYKQLVRSKVYRVALAMPKSTKKEQAVRFKAIKEALKETRKQYGFSEYALHTFVGKIQRSWLSEHIDSFTAQKLATRAYNAVNRIFTGDAEKVRFKRYGELNSLEGKSNKTGIRWRDHQVKWSGLELAAIIDNKDKVITHGLNSRIKYVRLLRKNITDKTRYYVQLVCEGQPYQKDKNKVGSGTAGLDIGPSTIAEVNDHNAKLNTFCRELNPVQSEIRKLQRKLDRQRRANNPGNYNPNGTVKKGNKKWHNSKRYLQTKAKYQELYRKQTAHRKSLHGKMINDILRNSNKIYFEKLSYKAFQKNYGKSVQYRAPGMFISRLKEKISIHGGLSGFVEEFSTTTTALSQNCHCGKKHKKKLSQRWHKCECGITAQRDLYSAFLARHVKQDITTGKYRLNIASATKEWPKIKPFLNDAVTSTKDSTLPFGWVPGYKIPASFGI